MSGYMTRLTRVGWAAPFLFEDTFDRRPMQGLHWPADEPIQKKAKKDRSKIKAARKQAKAGKKPG